MRGLARIITRTAKRSAFRLKKYAPEILMTVGIVGGVASTVIACKQTPKAHDILVKAKEQIDEVHCAESDPRISEDEYSKEDATRELTSIYARTAIDLVKTYAPAVTIGVASIACIVGSNGIARKRLAGAIAAYTALDTSFRDYRRRVQDKVGVDKELEAFHNVEQDPEKDRDSDGLAMIKTDDRQVTVDGYSIYARCFDELNPNWKDNAEYNLMFLRGVQRYLQARLEADGYLFLNDVYKELGYPPTQAGQLVGWIYDPEDPNHRGDNVVSFGLYNPKGKSPALGDFINGYSKAVFLDFNVDGVIIDRI